VQEPRQSRSEVLLWHDQIHESQDLARMHFWRLSFSPSYKKAEIFEALENLFAANGVTSYVIYETLGEYDLLLRLWVPRQLGEDDLEEQLEEALDRLRLWKNNYLIVSTSNHWARVKTDSDYWPALDDPVISEVAAFNQAQLEKEPADRSERLQELIDQGALLVIPTDTRGIRMFIIFDHPREPLNRGARKHVFGTIQTACDMACREWHKEHPDQEASHVSVYGGTGPMTDFLVMARAPYGYFHEFVGQLSGALRATGLDEQYDIRPYTHVIADEMFAKFSENRPVKANGAPKLDIDEEETESLEYKATFALNVRRLIETREQTSDARVKHGVVRAVCGLLNSPNGGRLMIGILETRRELERTKDKLGYLTRLREEFGVEVESNQIESPPNALIGIEAEIGVDKLFPDVDRYQQQLRKTLQEGITPNPLLFTTLEIRKEGERRICVLTVQPGNVWFWGRDLEGKHEEFYVREAGSTRTYSGMEGDLYRRAHPRELG
jgi:hypothetical protein